MFSVGEMFIVVTIIILQETILVNGLANSFNQAKNRSTTSSTGAENSGRAVDGDRNPKYHANSCWEANWGDLSPYWMVDLERVFNITSVTVSNRGDCCEDRLHDFVIEACLENPEQVPAAPCFLCYNYIGAVASAATENLNCIKPLVGGRYVRIRGLDRKNENDRFTLCEVGVYVNMGSCFDYSFIRHPKSRNTGTADVILNTSRVDCSDMCVRHSTCVEFNYNIDEYTCELVTVSGSVHSSTEWDNYQIKMK